MNRGFALPLALVVLATIGGLAAALLFVAMVSRRSGGAMLELVQTQFESESDAVNVAHGLTAPAAVDLPVSDAPIPMHGGQVTRFGSAIWFVGGGGSGSAFGSRRRAGLVVTVRPPEVVVKQAFATPGPVEMLGVTLVDLWGGSAGERCEAIPVDTVGLGFAAPAYEELDNWLPEATALLPDGTTISPAPAMIGGACDDTVVSNWGNPVDPAGICRAHYTAVSVAGDLVVEGGVGQGLLLVEGDLVLRSGFEFRGFVLVGGRLVVEQGGAEIHGAVQVNDTGLLGSALENARILYSGCALRAALSQFGEVSAIGRKAWFQLY